MDGYITASEAAQLFGFTRFYGAKLAKMAHKAGKPFPIKVGRSWMAPISEWEKIFNDPNIKQRRPRKKLHSPPVSKNEPKKRLITASQAANECGISSNWASKLAKRSQRKGYEWPKKMGRFWMAPLEEWIKVFNSDELKKWSRKE